MTKPNEAERQAKDSQIEHEPEKQDKDQDWYEEEPEHPGWLPLPKVLDSTDPFFDHFLFLLGYDMSCNVYAIKGDYLTLVDPGNDYTSLMALFQLGYQPHDIKKIAITHGHRDHCMGVFELIGTYLSTVEDKDIELILHEDGPDELKKMIQEMGCRLVPVKGGETLELSGQQWEVIYTPGHTIDGVCFYHAPSKTVITGDTVLPHQMAEPDKSAGGDMQHYLFALKSLLARDIENVLPGHGAPAAGTGRTVVEETYQGLMMKIIGTEDRITWIQGARALVQKGLFEEAVYCCDKWLANHPEDVMACQLKALCLNDLGRFPEALEQFAVVELLVDKPGGDPFTLMGKGYALMGMAKYAESIQLFDQALEIRPEMKDVQLYKGMALYLSGDYDKAMDIEVFRTEFVGRFKDEMLRRVQPGKTSDQ